MMAKRCWIVCGLVAGVTLVGCGEPEPPVRQRARRSIEERTSEDMSKAAPSETEKKVAEGKAPAGQEWGTIKGQIVWDGGDIPVMPALKVEKDTDWCLAEGPIKAETLVVDPETKGVENVFVYVRKPDAVHPDYPQDKDAVHEAYLKKFEELNGFKLADLQQRVKDKKVELRDIKVPAGLIDQVHCRYVPHALAVQEGQSTLVLNPETITHNVKVNSISGRNSSNPNMPPGTFQVFDWVQENSPLPIQCSIHGWMTMNAMVFDHPYFAVTGKDGSFELKNVPAGEVALVLRNPKYIDAKTGGKGTARGTKISVKPGETTDLTVKMKAQD